MMLYGLQEMLESFRSTDSTATQEQPPVKIDDSLEPGAMNRMMSSPVLGALEAGAAISGANVRMLLPNKLNLNDVGSCR